MIDKATIAPIAQNDPIAAILRAKQDGVDIWEMAVSVGVEDGHDADEKRWRLGDLATLIESSYGEGSIERYADEINERKTRVYECRRVSSFFPYGDPVREDLRQTLLRHTHFAAAVRLKDRQAAIALLNRALNENWKVNYTEVEVTALLKGKRTAWFTLFEGLSAVGNVSHELEYATLKIPVDALSGLRTGQIVKLKVQVERRLPASGGSDDHP